MSNTTDPPTAILKLSRKLSKLPSMESMKMACQYRAKSTDVFLIGVNKTGTTWMQHVNTFCPNLNSTLLYRS